MFVGLSAPLSAPAAWPARACRETLFHSGHQSWGWRQAQPPRPCCRAERSVWCSSLEPPCASENLASFFGISSWEELATVVPGRQMGLEDGLRAGQSSPGASPNGAGVPLPARRSGLGWLCGRAKLPWTQAWWPLRLLGWQRHRGLSRIRGQCGCVGTGGAAGMYGGGKRGSSSGSPWWMAPAGSSLSFPLTLSLPICPEPGPRGHCGSDSQP